MSLYTRLQALVYDAALARMEAACLQRWRRELLVQASGDVLEVGSGTGANLDHYPQELTSLTLREPDPHMLTRLRQKLPTTPPYPITLAAEEIDRLAFDAGRFDTIVATLVFCSVPDPVAALVRLRRLLKPDGRLLFIEHVVSRDSLALRCCQKTLQPFWRPLAGNCHLARDTETLIRAAGFSLQQYEYRSSQGGPFFVRPTLIGAATPD